MEEPQVEGRRFIFNIFFGGQLYVGGLIIVFLSAVFKLG